MFEQFLISVSNDVGTDGEGAEHIPMLLRSDPPSVPTRRQYLLSVVLYIHLCQKIAQNCHKCSRNTGKRAFLATPVSLPARKLSQVS